MSAGDTQCRPYPHTDRQCRREAKRKRFKTAIAALKYLLCETNPDIFPKSYYIAIICRKVYKVSKVMNFKNALARPAEKLTLSPRSPVAVSLPPPPPN